MTPILYAACVTPLQDEELYAAVYAAASPARRAKTDRYQFARDRFLSLGAETLLRHALREAGEALPAELNYGAQGKPELPGMPWHFNLSHSGDWAICALGMESVGCDIEKLGPARMNVAERFYTPVELARLKAAEEGERALLFYRLWTMKESFLKATGLGLSLPLNAFEITPEGEINQHVDDRRYSVREFSRIPGYCCAVCSAGECGEWKLQIVDLKQLFS